MEQIKFKNLSGWLKLSAITAWIIAGCWATMLALFVIGVFAILASY